MSEICNVILLSYIVKTTAHRFDETTRRILFRDTNLFASKNRARLEQKPIVFFDLTHSADINLRRIRKYIKFVNRIVERFIG